MTPRALQAWSEGFPRLVGVVAVAAGLVGGLLALLAWPGLPPLGLPRAAVFVFGGAWLLLGLGPRVPRARRIAGVAAALGVALGGVAGLRLLIAGAAIGPWFVATTRGALACPLLGLSMLALCADGRGARALGHALAAAAAALAFFELQVSLFSTAPAGIARSFLPHAAVHFLIAAGVLARLPEHGLFALFRGSSMVARAARRILPAYVLVAVVVGWLSVESFDHVWLDGPTSAAMGVALAAAAAVGIFRFFERGLVEASERERAAEAALGESEARFRALAEALRDAVVVTDAEGRILSWSPGAREMFGYSSEEALKLSIERLMPDRSWSDHRQTAEARDHELPTHPNHAEAVGCRKDGSRFPIELSLAQWQAKGQRFHGAVIRDASARRRSEEAQARLTRAVEQSAESVMITNGNAEIVYVNPAFERITGHDRSEVLGRNPRLLKSGAQPEAFYADLWATLKRGETWRGRFKNRRKDGSLLEEEASISPVRDASGEVVNYVAVKRDVTEEERLQRQFAHAQRLEGLGRLAGGVAHDFNNLLGVILGYTDLLGRRLPPDDDTRVKIDSIRAAAERGAALTRQLLAFSRRQALDLRPLDLNAVVSGFTSMLERVVGEDVALRLSLAPGPLTVKADAGQLEQILMNLAVNARDAMLRGGTLGIETRAVEIDAAYLARHPQMTPGAHVELSVSDDGCGMDERTQTHAFEPFFTTKEEGKGTGLGLATVYGIVKQTGGFIWLYSELGRGTTFKIYLPSAEQAPEPALRAPGRSAARRDATVLLVEDDPALREATAEMLKQSGYRVLAAAGPTVALEQAASHAGPIHLLVSDVIMPDLTGPELARRLRALRPGLAVLFMSGYGAEALARQGVPDAVEHVLAKPFSLGMLADAVGCALEAGSAPVGKPPGAWR